MKRGIFFSTAGFFLLLLIAGILIYKDYGIPWDETGQTRLAILTHRYIFKHDPAIFSYTDLYYGVTFELPYLWITTHLPITKHLLVFLTFTLGLGVFYFLARKLFRSPAWALLASVLLAASPRIFADSFYNSKDIPFMVVTTMGMWVLILMADQLRASPGRWKLGLWVTLLALASAVMIDTRVAGIVILPMALLVFLLNLRRAPQAWVRNLVLIGGYLLLTTGLVILLWPTLWRAPWREFLNAFQKMSQYPFNRTVLYMGSSVDAAQLPWHYLPVWMGITTPLIVLVGLLPGLGKLVKSLAGKWRHKEITEGSVIDPAVLQWTLVILWLILPLGAVFVFQSVLYDGWRQMFFIFPAIVLVSVLGLKTGYEYSFQHFPWKNRVRFLGGLIVLAGLAEPVAFMARFHPFENVYFNALAGNPANLRSRFEMDYWGLSYKQAIDHILITDARPEVCISFDNPSGTNYVDVGLPKAQKSRLKVVDDPSQADYFLTEFRWHPQDYPYQEIYYSIEVRGAKIMAVYKMPRLDPQEGP